MSRDTTRLAGWVLLWSGPRLERGGHGVLVSPVGSELAFDCVEPVSVRF
jgi:hypothetical protein